ncbi:uncharacterized protein NECHADRAFT_30322 [Fusarium vanettenii 77-13-4]|uniref:Heterokaryon incompatibility domain-containing protein n=1 Tax=Fusarium vanettenii (strain ATCC MYA-4622 / CBS 123669 / FGSC 9596 / NRRL 45880 / 77-13-4) TaxID=660122 RepID=C7YVQ4_FUSV7|nr:uncharacterized protein NECHADRAFT_30322 [Fusarium vanettenii 77-13-4]EEU43833.1 hypothetical protein NECHADRAFT_30322 [Fusarium vanettenii 77-13-4]
MESTDPEHYQVALVLPVKGDYETAVKLLDVCFTQRSLDSSGAEYSLGKAGSHHLVLVTGLSNISAAESVARVVPDLIKEYSFIRACFLAGVGAIAPSGGLAQAGDIVVGMPQGYESGLVQFDADKSRHDKRLHVTGHWRKPPSFVNPAVDETLSTQGRDEWHMNVGPSNETAGTQGSPSRFNMIQGAPKVLKGRVGSSSTALGDPELLQRLASDSGILCFETAAANLQTRLPLVVVCGISQGDPSLPQQENASKLATTYAMFLARHLNRSELAKGVRLGHLFIHQPFSLGGSTIRLLRLHGGTEYPIQCSMFEACLKDQGCPMDYEALSYAWESDDKCDMINVNGRVLHITRSLHGALQHLRHRKNDRILWADAVCIDQNNIMERGHQVAQMGSIYKKASNVIVWLGSVDKDVGLLISALRSLQLKVSPQPFKQWQLRDDRWRDAWEELHGGDISGGSFHLQLSNGLDMLTRKPWFTRVWIIQEVANAKSAQIQCSAGSIEAMFLALAPWLLGQSIGEQPQAVFDIFPGLPRKWSWWAEERTLWALLSRFRKCQATDPRDRVYALLGITSDMANDAIDPDYSKSEHQVLRDTCNYLFGEEQFAELSGLQRTEQLQRELSTWAGAFLEQKMMRRVKPEDLEHFLERQGRVEWTEKIVQLASFDLGHSTLTLLLTKFETPLPITVKLFREALKIGPDALDLLFTKCMIPPRLANGMIELMFLFPVQVAERLYLGRWKHEYEISESMTMKIFRGGTPLVDVFLRSETSKLQITEAVLRQASFMPDVYLRLLERRSEEVNVSEEEAIQAIKGGPETLRRCLDKPGTNFQVTRVIFEAAMLSGTEVAEMLFRRRESEANICQEIQEIHQLRDDLCEMLERTPHTTMLREALARYEELDSSGLALTETTDVAQWQKSNGVRVSRSREVRDLFRELQTGRNMLDISPCGEADDEPGLQAKLKPKEMLMLGVDVREELELRAWARLESRYRIT